MNNAWDAGRFLMSLCMAMTLSMAAFASEPSSLGLAASSASGNSLLTSNTNVWEGGIGEGFRPLAHTLSLETGAALGMAIFGGRQAHDLALMSLSYGHMRGSISGEGHWYRGNFELRTELFGGAQYSPSTEWLVGLTPHLRYDFATGTRLVPFLDAGAGVTATSIGPPDLSHTFEFNLQATTGLHWFLADDLALTVEARYLHMSCAGIHHPNLGLNSLMGMVGLTRFF
jgi:hypothetical protein